MKSLQSSSSRFFIYQIYARNSLPFLKAINNIANNSISVSLKLKQIRWALKTLPATSASIDILSDPIYMTYVVQHKHFTRWTDVGELPSIRQEWLSKAKEFLLFDNVEATFSCLFFHLNIFAFAFKHCTRKASSSSNDVECSKRNFLCILCFSKNQRKSSETSIKSESEKRWVRTTFIDDALCWKEKDVF